MRQLSKMSELTTTIITQPMKPALSVKNKRFVKLL